MSGGSYDYLFMWPDGAELPEEALKAMAERARSMKLEDVAQELDGLIKAFDHFKERWERVSGVMKTMLDSGGDWGQEQLNEAVEKWRQEERARIDAITAVVKAERLGCGCPRR